MDMMFFIGLLVGSVITLILRRLFRKKEKPVNDNDKYKKGLYTTSYTYGRDEDVNGKKHFKVTYEVYCLENSATKTKVKVINLFSGWHGFAKIQAELEKRVNLTWVDTKDIEFVEKSLDVAREEKINKLLTS